MGATSEPTTIKITMAVINIILNGPLNFTG